MTSPQHIMTNAAPQTRARLDLFDPRKGLDRGAGSLREALWYACKLLFFLSAFPWPSPWRAWLLRRFGASVGRGTVIKPRTNIHLPWKLSVGDYAWIGEEVFVLNFEQVRIGAHACVSQRAFLCTGNHDYSDPAFSYRNAPITIEDGAWVGAQAFVGPGTTVGRDAVILAGSVVTASLPACMVCGGNPCAVLRPRWKR